ncbi:BnaC08g42040D [Brassica napus]|uniref:BnaC08g42040D protein n=1 Tax=Brassica napus TaxID=3708 RepID=A0A078H7Z8_BRANA|nr:BnaC08g42040D [Brassica napus]
MKITREHGESLDLLPSSGIVYVKAKEKFPSPSLSASSPSSTQQEIIFSVPTTTASKVMDFLEYGQELSVNVTDVTTRGYEVCFGPLRGFLPYNQLVHASKFGSFQAWAKPDLKDPSRHQKKSFVHSFVGNTLSVRVLTADKSTGILILTMKPVEGVEGLELNGSDAAIRKSSISRIAAEGYDTSPAPLLGRVLKRP